MIPNKKQILFGLILVAILLFYFNVSEGFSATMQAFDAAPSTSEVKGFYKTLLLYAHGDGLSPDKSLRLLLDFSKRLYGERGFRQSLVIEDVLSGWPHWAEPLDTASREPIPTKEEAINAEIRILAYIQSNYPQEPGGEHIVRNIIDDFGYRFVFDRSKNEQVALRPDFLVIPLTNNWINPIG